MKQVVHSKDEALRFVAKVSDHLGLEWEPQLIEIKRFKPPRSLPQNAIMHSMVRELANELGYSEMELKDWFKHMYGPLRRFSFGGVDKMIPMSTTEYTRAQMSDFIAQIERVAAENGYRFHDES